MLYIQLEAVALIVVVVAVAAPVAVIVAAAVERAVFSIKFSLTCPLAHCSVTYQMLICVNYNIASTNVGTMSFLDFAVVNQICALWFDSTYWETSPNSPPEYAIAAHERNLTAFLVDLFIVLNGTNMIVDCSYGFEA
jgi:hypothetical protein